MGNYRTKLLGLSLAEKIFTSIVLCLALIAIYLALTSGNTNSSNVGSVASKPGSTTSSTSSSLYSVLPPATVPPKVAECSQPLTYASNGDSGPISCSNGYLNVLEWKALATLEPTVMTLGYNATAAQVQSALCSDASDSDSDANTSNSNTIETTTYQMAALYYGWSFSPNPSAELSNGTC